MQQLGDHNEEMTLLLDMVNRNSIRINQLVSDLLNATKFIQLDRVKTPIDKLIDETLDLASDRLELGHIKVIKQYNSGHVSVLADTEKLKVAFLNIIINAVEAMDHNTGVLRISTSRQDHKCIIRFTDNGSGMDEETQGKLFEPFFTRKPKGYGLGLTNTQNIIFSHKGNINVISRPGEGTIFSVVLDIV
jgi:signal transduction histidine kinase